MKFVSFATAFSLLLVPALSGCADEEIKPGSVTAKYTLFPQTCSDLRLSQIRASAVRSDGSSDNSNTIPCTTSGEIVIDPVVVGTYKIVIDGLSDEPTPRATHSASQDGVVVSQSTNSSTSELTLTQKPGSVHVRWKFSDGLECIDKGVTQIEVKVIDFSNNVVGAAQTVACLGASFVDPDDQQTKSGALFPEVLIPEGTTFTVVVAGSETAGGTAVQRGVSDAQALGAGERKTLTVTLEPIPLP